MLINVAVLCKNSEGAPEFFLHKVEVTQDQYDDCVHYSRALLAAANSGYEEPMIAFDQNDPAARDLKALQMHFAR